MTAKIIDGKKLAENHLKTIKDRIKQLDKKPHLAIILVGDDPASKVYVDMKEKDCKKVGFDVTIHRFNGDIDEIQLMQLIDKLNGDSDIDGIITQLPLPEGLDEQLIVDSILPHKDVDGFTPFNLGNLLSGNPTLVPATPKGIIELIKSTNVDINGKHAVVVGRSATVGKPISVLLLQENATVTMCHSKTVDIAGHIRQADILVVAVGNPRLITADMIKEGAIVIDVGINREGNKLVGDVDFDNVKKKASYITPVPGGVGPMTRAMLLENTLIAKSLLPR